MGIGFRGLCNVISNILVNLFAGALGCSVG